MKVLIIEDEMPAALQLKKMLGELDQGIQVVDTLDSIRSTVTWFKHNPIPNLVFMDIQIADGLSFSIFEQTKVPAPVIFTTAFDQFAIQAFRVNAVDYLLKPVDSSELANAIDKHHQRRQPHLLDAATIAALLPPQKTYKNRFLVRNGSYHQPLPIEEIARFISEDGLTLAITREGRRHLLDQSLDELDGLVDPSIFFRVNRATILRLDSIAKIIPYFSNRLKLEVIPPPNEEIFVSRNRVSAFRQWMGE